MGMKSRTKGKAGEREVAALLSDLLGSMVTRRVRQRDGDSDLIGLPGWSVEVKRHATASRADLRAWWAQAVAQAGLEGDVTPVMLYRRDRDEWRAVWPLGECRDYGYTVEGSLQAFAMHVREVVQ